MGRNWGQADAITVSALTRQSGRSASHRGAAGETQEWRVPHP